MLNQTVEAKASSNPGRVSTYGHPGARTGFILLLISLLTSGFAAAQSGGRDRAGDITGLMPRLYPEAAIAEIGSQEEPLSMESLIRVSLLASGLTDDDIPLYEEKLAQLLQEAPDLRGDAAVDGRNLLEWMHESVLKRYVESQTRLDVLLEGGSYNCVSSAVLYFILARNASLNVGGVLTTDHAFCRIFTDSDESGGIDVETTTSYGFDPGTRREAVDAFSGRTGFTYVPPGKYRLRRDINEKELVSLIYQNRMAALQRSRGWTDAVGLARDRWELAGTEAAKEDFRTSIRNYGAEMDRLKRNNEALDVVVEAVEILGSDHRLDDTAQALLGNAVTYSLRQNDIEKAWLILETEATRGLVSEPFLEERRRDVAVRELDIAVKSDSFRESVPAVDEALAGNLISPGRWSELMIFLWSGEARRISIGGNWLEGWLFLSNAPDAVRGIRTWPNLEDTYAHNAAVVFHNRFADAMGRGNRETARAILDEALSYFPEDSTLENDLKLLER